MNRAGIGELKKSCLPRLCLDTLSSEHVVFSKMLYRGKNQHRHDKSFQKMNGVSRQIKKYLSVNLSVKVKMLIKQLFSIKATARSILPRTVQLIEEVYLLLLESATFTADLLQFTEDTWREVNQRLVKALFIPFNTVMLASLSRIWFCLRFHLLGIAETYAVLKNTALQTTSPVSHVVQHLKQCHRKYLDTPALRHLQLAYATNEPTPSVMQAECRLSSDQLKVCPPTVCDMGVAIKLTEEELQARARDFKPSAWQPLPSGSDVQPTSGHVTSGGSHSVDRQTVAAINSGKMKKRRRRHRSRHRKKVCQTLQQKLREKEEEDKKVKKKKYRRKEAKRLQKTRSHTGNFRQIIMKCSGRQKFIIGSKVWTVKRTKKIVAGKKHMADAGSSNKVNWLQESGEDSVHDMQLQLDRSRATGESDKYEAGASTVELDSSDDIDTIFLNLQ